MSYAIDFKNDTNHDFKLMSGIAIQWCSKTQLYKYIQISVGNDWFKTPIFISNFIIVLCLRKL